MFSRDDAQRFVLSRTWTYAVTYPTMPHEWCVRNFRLQPGPDRDAEFGLFRDMDRWIRSNSDTRTRANYKAVVLVTDHGAHQYWPIFPVINRAAWCLECDKQLHTCSHSP